MSVKKEIKRNKLSDSQLKAEITTLFNSGISGKMEVFGNIRNTFTIARDRFTKMYDLCYSEWGKIKEQATTEATVHAAGEAARIGLKSKIEKQLHLQEQVNGIQADLNRGIVEDYVFIQGKYEMVEKVMNAETKAYLRKTIKEIYAEINKMDGDYAPVKVANTDPDGNPSAPTILNFPVGLSIEFPSNTEE